MSAVSSHYIRKQLVSLNPKKAVGLDDVSSLFLRDAADQITLPVSHIINLSLLSETVPRCPYFSIRNLNTSVYCVNAF